MPENFRFKLCEILDKINMKMPFPIHKSKGWMLNFRDYYGNIEKG